MFTKVAVGAHRIWHVNRLDLVTYNIRCLRMPIPKPITDTAIDAIAAAIFGKPKPRVLEAYSECDHEPIVFGSQADLVSYIHDQVIQPQGLAFFFVVYQDMLGNPVRRTIYLDSKDDVVQKVRYTWTGWGLISVQLFGLENSQMSRISANTATRASKWALTYPEWEPPSTWNWKAVESHTRRLSRILKSVT